MSDVAPETYRKVVREKWQKCKNKKKRRKKGKKKHIKNLILQNCQRINHIHDEMVKVRISYIA